MNDPNSFRSQVRFRLIAMMLASGLFIAWFAVTASAPSSPLPLFGRLDVLACGLICAMPLAFRLAQRAEEWSRSAKAGVAVALSLSGVWLLRTLGPLAITAGQGEITLALWRVLVTLFAATGIAMGSTLFPRRQAGLFDKLAHWGWSGCLLGLALFVPAIYADAVADGIRGKLRQSLESQRLALAFQQTAQLRRLKPAWSVKETPLDRLERQLGTAVANLTAEANRPFSSRADFAVSGRRITLLVQLERNEEALQLLQSLTQREQPHPVALDYRGLCYQRLEQPQNSLAAYRQAVAYWKRQPDSEAQRQGLASGYRGIGFAARRLENRSLEEQAYRRAVEIAPTAENHFLLAQSYREHQKSELAASHVSQAMELDPTYENEARSMLSTLSMDHFGCLQIPRR